MEPSAKKLLQNLAETAAAATAGARDYVQNAGKAVSDAMSEKSAAVKLTVELSRLRAEQDHLFSDIGRTMFLINSGAIRPDASENESKKTPQQMIDDLLVSAEQLQQQIDAANDKRSSKDEKACPKCGQLCAEQDTFCAICGTKLSSNE
ncbi:MAG: zinc ribbon domain-containing protein [Ruthenibacterium sp.]